MSSSIFSQPLIQYLDQHQFPCQVEGAAKFCAHGVETERFVFEIDKTDISLPELLQLADQFQAPASYQTQFQHAYRNANAILLGLAEDPKGIIYKIYFEYWDQICQSVQANPTHRSAQCLHLGFKWFASKSEETGRSCSIDRYFCHPLLSISEVIQACQNSLPNEENSNFCHAVIELLRQLSNNLPSTDSFIFANVEPHSDCSLAQARQSFIVNVNKAQLKLGQAFDLLKPVITAITPAPVPLATLAQLLKQQQTAWLGNIACGKDRQGNVFFTLYYAY